jgi:hypothetical protein
MLRGVLEIDVDDWQLHCDYVGWGENPQVPNWFFEMLRSASQDRRKAVRLQSDRGRRRGWG